MKFVPKTKASDSSLRRKVLAKWRLESKINGPKNIGLRIKQLKLAQHRTFAWFLLRSKLTIKYKERPAWVESAWGAVKFAAIGLLILLAVEGIAQRSVTFERLNVFWHFLVTQEGSEIVRNLGLLLLGAIGMPLAIWRSKVASNQARVASRQADTAERGQVTDRYNVAISHLGRVDNGEPNIAMRIGAIYALSRIAMDSTEDAQRVFDVLSAYVRMESQAAPLSQDDRLSRTAQDTPVSKPLRADIDAVMKVCKQVGSLVSAEVDFTGASLQGANLAEALLESLRFVHSDLTDANIRNTDLSYCLFEHTLLIRTDFFGSNLGEARMNYANLSGANLTRANLSGADMFGVNLSGADLSGADLFEAKLVGANLEGANLKGADLNGANLGAVKGWGTAINKGSIKNLDKAHNVPTDDDPE